MTTEARSANIDEVINDKNLIVEESYARAYYSPSLKVMGVVWDGIFTKEQ